MMMMVAMMPMVMVMASDNSGDDHGVGDAYDDGKGGDDDKHDGDDGGYDMTGCTSAWYET